MFISCNIENYFNLMLLSQLLTKQANDTGSKLSNF
jgi:hypothetical protein